MHVLVEMVDGEKRSFNYVEEINFRTDFNRIILFQNGWKLRTVIPADSFICYTEED